MRLIDADVLIEGRVGNDPVVIAAMCASTVDAVPVVRCKDCEDSHKALYGWLWCTAGPCGGKAVQEDSYCKCGARRTENAGD